VNNTLVFTYSAWYLQLAIAVSAAACYWLYYRNGTSDEWSLRRRAVLGFLRFMIIFILCFLLLVPVLKKLTLTTQKPLIVIAQDNSESIVFSKDSVYNRTILPNQMDALVQKLSAKFEVKTVQFGRNTDSLKWQFTDKETNFETLFSIFNTGLFNRNIGAMIISSDGIVNRGISPVFASQNLPFPIYCIALGDTGSLKDLSIKHIDCNKIAFKGNTVPIFVNVSATDFKGQTATVEMLQHDKILGSQTVIVDEKHYFKKLFFQIKADSLGVNEYNFRIQSSRAEDNLLNNSKRIYIEVTENQKKILLLFNGYHPDIAVFQHALSGNQAFKLTKIESNQPVDSIEKYDMVILHQLPSKTENLQKVFAKITELDIPVLYVIGQQTSISALNNLKTAFRVERNKELFTDVFPSQNASFSLFKVSFDPEALNGFPPLQIPFGNYTEAPAGNSLVYQKIGQINSNKPLWFFAESGTNKSGYILGEGIWKWYLTEYSQFSNHNITTELITKTVLYLTSTDKKEPLVVELPAVLDQDKPVIINAKLYNPSYELVNEPELTLELTDDKGNIFPFVFQKTDWAYSLPVGNLPIGTYRYLAKTVLGGTVIQKAGKFIVQESQLERNELIANHQLLYKLANEHRGKLFYKEQMDELTSEIMKSETILPVIFEKKDYLELINFKVFFILLVVLACSEWFLRKFWGSL
jgi:hypothetical protein